MFYFIFSKPRRKILLTVTVSIVCIINDIPLPLSRCNHSCAQRKCLWIQISLHLTLWSNFEGIPLNFHTPWLCSICFPLRYAPVINIGIPTIGIPTLALIFTLILSILIFIFLIFHILEDVLLKPDCCF